MFRDEQRTYESEGIQWHTVTFEDNSACLQLFESRPGGMMALLDEECLLPTGSDSGFLGKALSKFSGNDNFAPPRGSRGGRKVDGFVVRHFADSVTYDADGFVEKNRDRMHADLLMALQSTKSEFLLSLFAGVDCDINSSGGGGSKRRRPTQARVFQQQLDNLSNLIKSTDRHFISVNLLLVPLCFGLFFC